MSYDFSLLYLALLNVEKLLPGNLSGKGFWFLRVPHHGDNGRGIRLAVLVLQLVVISFVFVVGLDVRSPASSYLGDTIYFHIRFSLSFLAKFASFSDSVKDSYYSSSSGAFICA